MAQAKTDQNGRKAALGVSSTDHRTPVAITMDAATLGVLCSDFAGSDVVNIANYADIDKNNRPTMYGVSDADGKTLIPIATDNNGRLLIQLT